MSSNIRLRIIPCHLERRGFVFIHRRFHYFALSAHSSNGCPLESKSSAYSQACP
jgi:hypothetical protein